MPEKVYPPQVISALIRVMGWNQARIAKKLGISKASVSYSIQTGARPSVTAFVSELLGIPESVLWPYRRHHTLPSGMSGTLENESSGKEDC